mmetsp:Transcript_30531/g.97167  ORF Transcript_30531/g.97167 Transcript_30531/m.97167 type:complete len:312 (-) Transcript_30531:1498-2433(-)
MGREGQLSQHLSRMRAIVLNLQRTSSLAKVARAGLQELHQALLAPGCAQLAAELDPIVARHVALLSEVQPLAEAAAGASEHGHEVVRRHLRLTKLVHAFEHRLHGLHRYFFLHLCFRDLGIRLHRRWRECHLPDPQALHIAPEAAARNLELAEARREAPDAKLRAALRERRRRRGVLRRLRDVVPHELLVHPQPHLFSIEGTSHMMPRTIAHFPCALQTTRRTGHRFVYRQAVVYGTTVITPSCYAHLPATLLVGHAHACLHSVWLPTTREVQRRGLHCLALRSRRRASKMPSRRLRKKRVPPSPRDPSFE